MKAIEKLENINVWGDVTQIQEQIDEVIAELQSLENRSCKDCKNINKSNCVFCLSCSRQYSDNWSQNDTN